jgi:hypothetical protein
LSDIYIFQLELGLKFERGFNIHANNQELQEIDQLNQSGDVQKYNAKENQKDLGNQPPHERDFI